jgi:hypothetical protein
MRGQYRVDITDFYESSGAEKRGIESIPPAFVFNAKKANTVRSQALKDFLYE